MSATAGQWDRGADRISRHWYDLARLSEHEVGEAALEDRYLLADVVAVKNVHFSRSTSHYEDCTTGGINADLPKNDGAEPDVTLRPE